MTIFAVISTIAVTCGWLEMKFFQGIRRNTPDWILEIEDEEQMKAIAKMNGKAA